MSALYVVAPALNTPVHDLVDWLELSSFFNEYGTARLDDIISSLNEQAEEQEEDIGRLHVQIDSLVADIEDEIRFRENSCIDCYPFLLSENAEEMTLKPDYTNNKYVFYLVCLLTSHIPTDGLYDFKVDESIVNQLRNGVFQTISTLAMAGLTPGIAISVGWPRPSNQSILDVLQTGQQLGSGYQVRKEIGVFAPRNVKDGGVDVISWTDSDRCPPSIIYYAQVASGKNWRGKPVTHYIEAFEDNFFEYRPRGNRAQATLIPFRVIDNSIWMNEHVAHGTLLDRTRLPYYANTGLTLAEKYNKIDEVNNLPAVTTWVSDFKSFVASI